MRLIDHLDDDTKEKLIQVRKKKRRKKKRGPSFREIKELMGMGRDRYYRAKGGAIRRK